MTGGIPRQLRVMASAVGFLVGGFFMVSLASSVAIRALQSVSDAKKRKLAISCMKCKGKGFYTCKLCKGNSTIEWSPLYDPIAINPCLCPTCDGNRLQHMGTALPELFGEGLYLNIKQLWIKLAGSLEPNAAKLKRTNLELSLYSFYSNIMQSISYKIAYIYVFK